MFLTIVLKSSVPRLFIQIVHSEQEALAELAIIRQRTLEIERMIIERNYRPITNGSSGEQQQQSNQAEEEEEEEEIFICPFVNCRKRFSASKNCRAHLYRYHHVSMRCQCTK